MASATIKLFLPHGDPKCLRTAEISNWSGKAVAAPRIDFEALLDRDEMGQSGVYVLTESDPETGNPMAYVGEADVLRDRLESHKVKDFWVTAVAFLSKDENLTKSHIRFLEGCLLEEAKATGRFTLDNTTASGSRLPEADRHDMEEFLEKIRQLLPVLGSELLTPVASGQPSSGTGALRTDIKGVTATGQRTPTGFVVFRGSQAVLTPRPGAAQHVPFVLAKREALTKDGGLVQEGDRLVFARDVEFSSPSAAAAVVHGQGHPGLGDSLLRVVVRIATVRTPRRAECGASAVSRPPGRLDPGGDGLARGAVTWSARTHGLTRST